MVSIMSRSLLIRTDNQALTVKSVASQVASWFPPITGYRTPGVIKSRVTRYTRLHQPKSAAWANGTEWGALT
ncbi:hypothetical protein SAMN05216276_108911 [Streptosporangium subroseum]|uniref:Uncharacterized protein n=1 Tax=Streptosporangium subroseum TaxID=106412 RepID=A0A239P598_9ACTN|nr:hypothetical protein SAMN05216276_108911 [Streptosporangium subroseum]